MNAPNKVKHVWELSEQFFNWCRMNLLATPCAISFLDVCADRLEVFNYLEGTEIKKLRASCSIMEGRCAERALLRDLGSLGCWQSLADSTIHKAICEISIEQRWHSTIQQVYNAAYSSARIRGCGISAMLAEVDSRGNTPLYVAVKASRHGAINMLLHLGANVNEGSTMSGWSPLLLAAWKRDLVAIKLLIDHGADVDHTCGGPSWFTPLSVAAAAECLQACTMLVAAGADVSLAEKHLAMSSCARRDHIIEFMHLAVARPWRAAELQAKYPEKRGAVAHFVSKAIKVCAKRSKHF